MPTNRGVRPGEPPRRQPTGQQRPPRQQTGAPQQSKSRPQQKPQPTGQQPPPKAQPKPSRPMRGARSTPARLISTLLLCALMLALTGAAVYGIGRLPGSLRELVAPAPTPAPTPEPTPTPPPDTVPPVITGVHDITVSTADTISYRDGVTVTDDQDAAVQLQIDSSGVDLTTPGIYTAYYSAADAAGNTAQASATVTVIPAEIDNDGEAGGEDEARLDELCEQILAEITTDDMTDRDKAYAIYDYIKNHVRYVDASDKSSWIDAAYSSLLYGRGDCYNFFAASKALLTHAGIPSVDVERVGGNSPHYWQLVNCGDGWYHFDTCPRPDWYVFECFLRTEIEVREYTANLNNDPNRQYWNNYYVYDYDACPVTAEGFPGPGDYDPLAS